jgi:hypothetical protein
MTRLAVLACLLMATPAAAQTRPDPVRVEIDALFGEGMLLGPSYTPVLVTLENRTDRDLAGELEVWMESYDGGHEGHVVALDLPAHQTRQANLTLYVGPLRNHVSARYVSGGRALGRGAESVVFNGAQGVVVLGDPPRLRGALLDLEVEEAMPHGPRQVRVPIGAVSMDARSGDPLLPEEPAGWASVKLLVASAHVLARLSDGQREAIADWLRTGGRLLVLPRSAAELEAPFLRELAGTVGAEPSRAGSALVPEGLPHLALSCSEGQRAETFGCSAPVGLGRVYLASYDAMSAAAIETGMPRELVRSVYAAAETSRPVLAFGRGHDSVDPDEYYYGGASSFGALRATLDPNEGFRPALVLAALVLLLYVVVVGPINFGWVQRKNRPTLALITTPLAALGCMIVLLIVGYIGKGVSMRYRRFEVVELVEGQERAPARRYTGLYSTRPGSFDLPVTPRGEIARRIDGGRQSGPTYVHEGHGVRLADFRAGLWETVFLREDRIVDLGGTIRFERDGRRLSAVVNDSPRALTDAFVVDTGGALYRVGDVAAGTSSIIPRASTDSVRGDWYGADESLRRAMPDITEEDAPYLRGLVRLMMEDLVPRAGDAPVLYARVPLPPSSIGDVFSHEADHRWIRVVASMRGASVAFAAPPTDPDDELYGPSHAELAGDAGVASDAGIPEVGP